VDRRRTDEGLVAAPGSERDRRNRDRPGVCSLGSDPSRRDFSQRTPNAFDISYRRHVYAVLLPLLTRRRARTIRAYVIFFRTTNELHVIDINRRRWHVICAEHAPATYGGFVLFFTYDEHIDRVFRTVSALNADVLGHGFRLRGSLAVATVSGLLVFFSCRRLSPFSFNTVSGSSYVNLLSDDSLMRVLRLKTLISGRSFAIGGDEIWDKLWEVKL